jgi:hypothetical protein
VAKAAPPRAGLTQNIVAKKASDGARRQVDAWQLGLVYVG